MQPAPLISIILVNWNSHEYLSYCLHALSRQTLQRFDVILIDNNSIDKSLSSLKVYSTYLRLSIKHFTVNLGYSVANNVGVNLAKGKWIALLNADAFPEPDWLEKLLLAAEQNPEYKVFASRQIQYNKPDLLDGAGDSYHVTGLAWRKYYNRTVQEYGKRREEVFSACPAAALYSREEFLKAGGFDEDYFSYFEDVDLGFRLRLGGAKCLYVPEAVVHHVGSASTGKRSDFSVYYGYRNMIWTFVKNMPSPLFLIFLPLHIASVFFFILYFIARGQGKVILKAVFDAIRGLPKAFEKRKSIQKNIKIKPTDLLKVMSTGLFEPYVEFIERNKK